MSRSPECINNIGSILSIYSGCLLCEEDELQKRTRDDKDGTNIVNIHASTDF